MNRVCFDIRCLQIGHEKRGIGMHAISVLENLKNIDNIEYYFYMFDGSNPIKSLDIKLNIDYKIIETKSLNKTIHNIFDVYDVIKMTFHRFNNIYKYDIDTFVQFDFMLGLPKSNDIKKIAVAYDLIPLIFREEYLPSPIKSFKKGSGLIDKLRLFLRSSYYILKHRIQYKTFNKANKIVSISNDTSRQLIKILGIDGNKIKTIPLAPVLNISKIATPTSLKNMDNLKFIFYIGATDSRKKVEQLVSAFNIVRGRGCDIKLILSGSEFESIDKIPSKVIKKSIQNSSYIDDIILTGYVNDKEKVWLYKNAEAFVFPTTYEGFGLPIIEAMSCGCPVISYNNSSIPEVANESAILIETSNINSLVKSILEVAKHNNGKLISTGYINASNFTWEKHVSEFIDYIKT